MTGSGQRALVCRTSGLVFGGASHVWQAGASSSAHVAVAILHCAIAAQTTCGAVRARNMSQSGLVAHLRAICPAACPVPIFDAATLLVKNGADSVGDLAGVALADFQDAAALSSDAYGVLRAAIASANRGSTLVLRGKRRAGDRAAPAPSSGIAPRSSRAPLARERSVTGRRQGWKVQVRVGQRVRFFLFVRGASAGLLAVASGASRNGRRVPGRGRLLKVIRCPPFVGHSRSQCVSAGGVICGGRGPKPRELAISFPRRRPGEHGHASPECAPSWGPARARCRRSAAGSSVGWPSLGKSSGEEEKSCRPLSRGSSCGRRPFGALERTEITRLT